MQADGEQLPFEDGSFDATVAAFVINHMPDAERGAAELVRVTRPGGRVATAMWGPFDRVALLGLPARAAAAAGVSDDDGPGGPDSLRFTDASPSSSASWRSPACTTSRSDEIAYTLPVAGLDELWDGVLGGSVRTSRRLAAGETQGSRGAARDRRAVPRRRGLRAADRAGVASGRRS